MFFRDIAGYDELKLRMIKSVNDNRVSHAQLVFGPEGTPKLALALAYAQYVNCSNRSESDSCGVCPSCAKYKQLAHPDLHFIYPVATTKEVDTKPKSRDFISQWRELMAETGGDFNLYDWHLKIGLADTKQAIINAEDAGEVVRALALKAYEAEYKVLILWMVERMNAVSANRLLKILEEPPEGTLFLLITEDPDQLLSTILSRTQLVKVPALSESIMAQLLQSRYGLSAEAAARVAVLSDGNWILARRMAQTSGHEGVSANEFIEWLRDVFKLGTTKAWAEANLDILSRAAEFGRSGRENQKSFFLLAMRMVRYVMLQGLGASNLVKLEGVEAKFAVDFSKFVHAVNAPFYYELLQEAYTNIGRNANAQLLFIDLSYQLERVMRIPPPEN